MMSFKIFDTMIGMITRPNETFEELWYEDHSALYLAVLLLINLVLSNVLIGSSIFFPPEIITPSVDYNICVIIMGEFIVLYIGMVFDVIILHIFAYILGARNELQNTFSAMAYAWTPALLFGWIPLFGLLAFLWTAVLAVLGLKEMQEMSTFSAVAALFIMPILAVILLVGLIALVICL